MMEQFTGGADSQAATATESGRRSSTGVAAYQLIVAAKLSGSLKNIRPLIQHCMRMYCPIKEGSSAAAP